MAEKYIKASECEKYFYEHLDDNGMIGAMNAIDEMPAADVQPVKRGHWIKNYLLFYRTCSVCEELVDLAVSDRSKYCPYCGAYMRGEDNG